MAILEAIEVVRTCRHMAASKVLRMQVRYSRSVLACRYTRTHLNGVAGRGGSGGGDAQGRGGSREEGEGNELTMATEGRRPRGSAEGKRRGMVDREGGVAAGCRSSWGRERGRRRRRRRLAGGGVLRYCSCAWAVSTV